MTICRILRNPIYCCLVLATTLNFFEISAIQFWMTDYYIMVLNQKEKDVYITFAIICLTAPTLGAICGGWISKSVGGLASPKAYPVCFLVSFFNCILSLYLPVSNKFWIVNVVLSLNLFGGGVQIVLTYGMILNSLDVELRPKGNAFSQMIYNLLGFMPSPWIYG